MKVIIVAYNQFELLQMEIEALRLLAGIEERDLIIVDNGSEDGLRQWLEERPGMNYLICDEGGESYSAIVNYAKAEFQIAEDILLLNPCYMILPDSIEEMQRLLYADREIGAVMPKLIHNGSETARQLYGGSFIHTGRENCVGSEFATAEIDRWLCDAETIHAGESGDI